MKLDFPATKARNLVESVLKHMSDALVARRKRKNLIFRDIQRARQGRTDRAQPENRGRGSHSSRRRVMTFRPSHLMKDRVAAGNSK